MTQYCPGEYDDGNRISSSLSHTLLTLLSKNRGTVFQFFLGNNFILQAQLILVLIYIYGATHQALWNERDCVLSVFEDTENLELLLFFPVEVVTHLLQLWALWEP